MTIETSGLPVAAPSLPDDDVPTEPQPATAPAPDNAPAPPMDLSQKEAQMIVKPNNLVKPT